jgi:hypothetical protein
MILFNTVSFLSKDTLQISINSFKKTAYTVSSMLFIFINIIINSENIWFGLLQQYSKFVLTRSWKRRTVLSNWLYNVQNIIVRLTVYIRDIVALRYYFFECRQVVYKASFVYKFLVTKHFIYGKPVLKG